MNDDLNFARYCDERCERSFACLVESHLGLVLSVANRILRNPSLAEDAAQKAFTKLASQPEKVPTGLPVEAWLHRTTRSIAIDMVRAEEVRRRHEKTAVDLAAMKEPDAEWSRLSAEIDRALDELPTADRIAIVLRFFKNQTHAQVGAAIGVGEDASYMRIQRALEKLKRILSRRGLTFSAAVLATALPAHATTPVSAGLPALIARNSLSAAASMTGTTPIIFSILMKAKTILLPLSCVALLVTAISQRKQISKLSESVTGTTLPSSPSASSLSQRNSSPAVPTTKEGLINEVKRLCSIEPLASRQAALRRWAEQFTDNASMLEVADLLREAEDLSPTIRGRAAKVLTEHWTEIDPSGAMEAFVVSSLIAEASPFGAIRLDSSGLTHGFDLIARKNPAAFMKWVSENPNPIIDLFLEKPQSSESETLISALGRKPVSQRSFGRMLAARASLTQLAPLQLLAIVQDQVPNEGRPLGSVSIDSSLLGQTLVARFDQPHEIWSHFTQEHELAFGSDAMDEIADEIAAADSRPLEDILEEIGSLDSDWTSRYRLASLGPALTEAKSRIEEADSDAQDRWWSNFERYAEFVNSGSNTGDPNYDATRRQMAVLGASIDGQAAIEWAKTIVDDDVRFHAASELALSAAGIEDIILYPGSLDNLLPERTPGNTTVFISSETAQSLGAMVLGNEVEIPENPSVEQVIQITQQAMEGVDFEGQIRKVQEDDWNSGRPNAASNFQNNTLRDALRDRLNLR